MGSVCLCQMYLEAEDTVEGAEVPDGSIGHGEVVLRHGSGAAFVTWQRRPCVCVCGGQQTTLGLRVENSERTADHDFYIHVAIMSL